MIYICSTGILHIKICNLVCGAYLYVNLLSMRGGQMKTTLFMDRGDSKNQLHKIILALYLTTKVF